MLESAPREALVFRREALAHQRRVALGEPVDLTAITLWRCIIPLAGIACVLALVASLTYQPRVGATIVAATGGDLVVDVATGTEFLGPVYAGDILSMSTEASHRSGFHVESVEWVARAHNQRLRLRGRFVEAADPQPPITDLDTPVTIFPARRAPFGRGGVAKL